MPKLLKKSLFLLELIKRSNKIFRSKSLIKNKKELAQKIKIDAYENQVKGLYEQVKIKKENLAVLKTYVNSGELDGFIKKQEIDHNEKITNFKKTIVDLQNDYSEIKANINKNKDNKKLEKKKIKKLQKMINVSEKENLKLKEKIKKQNKKAQEDKKKIEKIAKLAQEKEGEDDLKRDKDAELSESLESLYETSSKITKSKLNLNDLTESKNIFSMIMSVSKDDIASKRNGEEIFINNIAMNLVKFGKTANDNLTETDSKIAEMAIENSQLENDLESNVQELAVLEDKDNKSSSENIGGASFYVSFADIISVLLCFFILFFAMGTIDGNKAKKLASTFTEKSLSKKQVFNAYVSEDEFRMLAKVKELMLDNVNPEDIVGSKTKTVAHIISGSDLFYPGETELSEEGIILLKEKFKKDMVGNIKELIIEGHTDDKEFHEFPEISKVYANNTELSAARSLRVVEILKKNLGLSEINIGIRAYGDKRPLKPNTNDINRALNRRVEIKITTEIKINEIDSTTLDSNSSEIKGNEQKISKLS